MDIISAWRGVADAGMPWTLPLAPPAGSVFGAPNGVVPVGALPAVAAANPPVGTVGMAPAAAAGFAAAAPSAAPAVKQAAAAIVAHRQRRAAVTGQSVNRGKA